MKHIWMQEIRKIFLKELDFEWYASRFCLKVFFKHAGHPIVNDPIYNTPVWGPNCGKGGDYGKDEAQVMN